MNIDDYTYLPDPTALPRIVTRDQLRLLGHTSSGIKYRISTGEWRRVLPRTYLTADTLTWHDRLAAALAFAGPGSLLSGAAALADVTTRSVQRPHTVLVLVPKTNFVESTAWVRIRPTDRELTRELHPGLPRATFARCVADLALETPRLDDVRALVAESTRRSLCTVEELVVELDAGPRRGSANLREALAEVTAGAWSAPEARAASLLRAAGLGGFEQNVRIDLPNGRWFIVDFLWRAKRAVLEIDSVEHHTLPADADRTSNRHLTLETLGYSVVHRTPRSILREPDAFTRDIARWLASRPS